MAWVACGCPSEVSEAADVVGGPCQDHELRVKWLREQLLLKRGKCTQLSSPLRDAGAPVGRERRRRKGRRGERTEGGALFGLLYPAVSTGYMYVYLYLLHCVSFAAMLYVLYPVVHYSFRPRQRFFVDHSLVSMPGSRTRRRAGTGVRAGKASVASLCVSRCQARARELLAVD